MDPLAHLLSSAMALFIGPLTLVGFAMTAIVRIGFAVAIHRDATNLGGRLVLVSPLVWALGTLTGGLLAVLAYWILHHSSLSGPETPIGAV